MIYLLHDKEYRYTGQNPTKCFAANWFLIILVGRGPAAHAALYE